uniref:Uncharacterized protein n=1 Tax=Kalanchoe fedtschenkoi TaxID=63787 RepID=A0A7N0RE15_KALFE
MSVQHVADFRHPQCHSRMPGLRLLDRVHDQHPHVVHASPVHQILENIILLGFVFVRNGVVEALVGEETGWEGVCELLLPLELVVSGC